MLSQGLDVRISLHRLRGVRVGRLGSLAPAWWALPRPAAPWWQGQRGARVQRCADGCIMDGWGSPAPVGSAACCPECCRGLRLLQLYGRVLAVAYGWGASTFVGGGLSSLPFRHHHVSMSCCAASLGTWAVFGQADLRIDGHSLLWVWRILGFVCFGSAFAGERNALTYLGTVCCGSAFAGDRNALGTVRFGLNVGLNARGLASRDLLSRRLFTVRCCVLGTVLMHAFRFS